MPTDATWERRVRGEIDQTRHFIGLTRTATSPDDGLAIIVVGIILFAVTVLVMNSQWRILAAVGAVAIVRLVVAFPALRRIGRAAR